MEGGPAEGSGLDCPPMPVAYLVPADRRVQRRDEDGDMLGLVVGPAAVRAMPHQVGRGARAVTASTYKRPSRMP